MPTGSIISRIRIDVRKRINGKFSDELTITAPGNEPITVHGLYVRHKSGYDSEGLPIIATTACITIYELDLTDAGLTIRNSNGDLIIQNWDVQCNDLSFTRKYKIREAIPDNVIGLIRCQLSDKE